MNSVLLVFFGAGLGGVARYGVNVYALRAFGPHCPVATLGVNVAGSLFMGLIAGWLAFKTDVSWSDPLKLFLTTGILGGFTTFSAFSLDSIVLYERGAYGLAAFYVGASVVFSLAALLVGLTLIRSL